MTTCWLWVSFFAFFKIRLSRVGGNTKNMHNISLVSLVPIRQRSFGVSQARLPARSRLYAQKNNPQDIFYLKFPRFQITKRPVDKGLWFIFNGICPWNSKYPFNYFQTQASCHRKTEWFFGQIGRRWQCSTKKNQETSVFYMPAVIFSHARSLRLPDLEQKKILVAGRTPVKVNIRVIAQEWPILMSCKCLAGAPGSLKPAWRAILNYTWTDKPRLRAGSGENGVLTEYLLVKSHLSFITEQLLLSRQEYQQNLVVPSSLW